MVSHVPSLFIHSLHHLPLFSSLSGASVWVWMGGVGGEGKLCLGNSGHFSFTLFLCFIDFSIWHSNVIWYVQCSFFLYLMSFLDWETEMIVLFIYGNYSVLFIYSTYQFVLGYLFNWERTTCSDSLRLFTCGIILFRLTCLLFFCYRLCTEWDVTFCLPC